MTLSKVKALQNENVPQGLDDEVQRRYISFVSDLRPTITDGVHTESVQYTLCLVRTQGMH